MTSKKYLLSFVLFLLTAIGCWAKNSVSPMTVGNVFVKLNDPQAFAPVNFMNWGDTEVKSIMYSLCNMDTHECMDPVTLNFDTPLAVDEVRKINIPIPAGTSLGKVDLMLHVQEVNGEYNEYSSPITYITRCTVNKVPHKRVLIEDYTALWCQWCPVGMVATEALVREHPDDVVAVSIHKGDKLATTAAYQNGMLYDYATTLPSVWCARKGKIAGYDGSSMYESEKNNLTLMNIDVKATWDEMGNNISVTTEVEPCANPEEGATYAVGYVLTASGLKDDKWLQQANYSDYMSDIYKDAPPEMDFFRDPANYVGDNYYVKGVTFNHVAIVSQGIRNGVVNSLPSVLKANEVQTHTTTFDNISQYSLIQDRNKLQVVAILFNTKTNAVENAAVCSISKKGEAADKDFSLCFEKSDWATLYTDRAYKVPQGVETYRVTEEGKVAQISDGTTATVHIAANTALLLKGKQGETYTFEYTDAANTTVETALRGSVNNELTTTGDATLTDADVYYYKLSYDDTQSNLGFYWGAEEGAAFMNNAGRCYLVLPRKSISANRKKGFALDADGNTGGDNGNTGGGDTPTGVKLLDEAASKKIPVIYDAMGRKVKIMKAPGIYIVNGKKVVME